jgi:hypothetical protein
MLQCYNFTQHFNCEMFSVTKSDTVITQIDSSNIVTFNFLLSSVLLLYGNYDTDILSITQFQII